MFVKVKKYWSKRVEYNMNEYFMKLALDLAKKSFKQNEIPVGCVLVNDKNEIISCASNSMVQNHDPTSHAEIVAIRKACKKLKTTKLLNFSIYTTLEPCLMCESLIISVGIKKIYFGAFSDNVKIHKRKMKNYFSNNNNYEFFGGFKEKECSDLIINALEKKR